MPAPIDASCLRNTHAGCFACGISGTSGLFLHFDVNNDGTATAVWNPSSAFQSYPGRVHGGVIATLLDSAIVHALFAQGVAGVTVELTTRYLQPVNLVDPVTIRGRVDAIRHGIFFCSAGLSQRGRTVVRAAAKFMAMDDLPPPSPETPNH
jgi:acyl-coenzyme A thioesterase PaaI-like protein